MPKICLTSKSLALVSTLMGMTACNSSGYTIEEALRVDTVEHLKYGDFDPVRIQGKQPKAFPVHGIDLSHHNPKVDWPRLKQQRVAFAFMKATQRGLHQDTRFKEYWADAKAAGIPRGAYHFFSFCVTPEKQAQNYISMVPKSDSALPPILDVEWTPNSKRCRKRPKPFVVRNMMKRWLDIVERHYGQKPIIYTAIDFYRDNLEHKYLPGYQYWLRSVKAEPKYLYGKRDWVFWQYTGTGKIAGVKGQVDINAYAGSRSDWSKWVKANTR